MNKRKIIVENVFINKVNKCQKTAYLIIKIVKKGD
jgi:hypothetical protein